MNAKTRALASSMRLPNLPGMASHVFAGGVLAAWGGGGWLQLAVLCSCGVGFGIFGNVLNDYADRQWDAQHRSERALPRGLFAPGAYFSLAISAAVLALVGCSFFGRAWVIGMVLVGCILAYTWQHKRCGFAVVWMGLCRALLPALGFVGMGGLGWAAAPGMLLLFLSTVGISRLAMGEWKLPALRSKVGMLLSLLPVVDMAVLLFATLRHQCSGGVLAVPVAAIVLSFALRKVAEAS